MFLSKIFFQNSFTYVNTNTLKRIVYKHLLKPHLSSFWILSIKRLLFNYYFEKRL